MYHLEDKENDEMAGLKIKARLFRGLVGGITSFADVILGKQKQLSATIPI